MKDVSVIASDGTQFFLKVLGKTETEISIEITCSSSDLRVTILVAADELDAWPAISSEQLKEDTAGLDEEELRDYMEDGPGAEANCICVKSGEGGYIISPQGLRQED